MAEPEDTALVAAATIAPETEGVRVLRVLEYVGARADVERTLQRSIQGVMLIPQRGAPLAITAVTVDDKPSLQAIRARVDGALDEARKATERLADLCARVCEALGWDTPGSPTERNNGARDVRYALACSDDAPAPSWWHGPVRPPSRDNWGAFLAKVRELAPYEGRPFAYGMVCAYCGAKGLGTVRRFGDVDVCNPCAPTVAWVFNTLEVAGVEITPLLAALTRGHRQRKR